MNQANQDIKSAVESLTDGRCCPACGSVKVGVAEVKDGGANRFKPVCAECLWTGGEAAESREAAAKANDALLRQWSTGARLSGDIPRVGDVRMVAGVTQKPRAGIIDLDMIAKVENPSVGQPFRPEADQKRFEAGESVGNGFRCDGCGKEEAGAIMAGKTNPETRQREDYYATPAGWFMEHPSARLFCSPLCVRDDRVKQ